MIPMEIAVFAEELRRLIPIIGFDRSVRWAWKLHAKLERHGFSIEGSYRQ